MIVGLLALLSMLFGGAANEVFFIEKLEKAVKEAIEDKDQRKDILADLKNTTKSVSKFNKSRTKQFKKFQDLNVTRSASEDDLIHYFEALQLERIEFQDKMIDERLKVYSKIDEAEFASILDYSSGVTSKRLEKEKKKAAKAKDEVPFPKTRKSINKAVLNAEKGKTISDGLDDMLLTIESFAKEVIEVNSKDNNLLTKQNASKNELKQLTGEMNKLRSTTYKQLVDFHLLVKENTNEAEWKKVMTAFNKELNVTMR